MTVEERSGLPAPSTPVKISKLNFKNMTSDYSQTKSNKSSAWDQGTTILSLHHSDPCMSVLEKPKRVYFTSDFSCSLSDVQQLLFNQLADRNGSSTHICKEKTSNGRW